MPDFTHPSGAAGAYLRADQKPDAARVVHRDGKYITAADLNDAGYIAEKRTQRVGDLVAADGDRKSGAEILIHKATGDVTLTAGEIYITGDVKPVAAAVLAGVPMTGEVKIGVRLTRTLHTEVEDPDLVGLHPGSDSEGEPVAALELETLAWAHDGDGGTGEFFAVYALVDGDVIDQTPPPALTGVNNALAVYDYQAHANYIVEGCRVTLIGKFGGAWHFDIGAGTANIEGYKRTRFSGLRHIETEQPDLEAIDAEPHTFADGGSGTVTIAVNHAPIDSVQTCTVEKEITEAVTKGVGGSLDLLANGSVTAIVSVTQGATTYADGVDYTLNADRVDWSAGGAEPATGSSYDVTYRYMDNVVPDSNTATEIVLSGGVTGGQVFVEYTTRLKRVDLLGLDRFGLPVYVKGLSARDAAYPPASPVTVLKLAEIHNDWLAEPVIKNNGTKAYSFDKIASMYIALVGALDLLGIERLRRDLDSRELAAKQGVFVDPFTSDRYRDLGEPQSLAVFGGSAQLAINVTHEVLALNAPVTLDFTQEEIIIQPYKTGCEKINPYANFEPLPGAMALSPSIDFWTETVTEFLSEQTREVSGNTNRTTSTLENVSDRDELIEHLRQIDIGFTIDGFGNGENLDVLTFDGLDVNPGGLSADGTGQVTGTFTIPAGVVAGVKVVRAEGAGGTVANAAFAGQGILHIDVVRRVTTITTTPPQRPVAPLTQAPGLATPWGEGGGAADGPGPDPQGQTFTLPEPRMVTGIDQVFCAKGNDTNAVLVRLVRVDNGIPTTDVIAEKLVNMAATVLDQWEGADFPLPIFQSSAGEVAVVWMTDDADHAIAVADVGGFDAARQEFVTRQPYTVGVRLSSSNATTWTAHQKSDVTFKVRAAKFGPLTKTVDLGTKAVVNMSDLQIRAGVELPTGEARCWFEVELDDGRVFKTEANTNLEIAEFYTGNVQVRAVLTGTEKISPVLYPGIMMVVGTLQSTGTYVSRAFDIGAAVDFITRLKTLLPTGSTVTVEADAADDNWTAVPEVDSQPIDGGWFERRFEVNPLTAQPQGRLKITLTGAPDARPSLADLRVAVV